MVALFSFNDIFYRSVRGYLIKRYYKILLVLWALGSMLLWGLLEVVKQGKVFVLLYSFRCVFTCVYSRLLFIKISSPFSIMSISVSHYSHSLPPLPPSLPPSLHFCLFLPLSHFYSFSVCWTFLLVVKVRKVFLVVYSLTERDNLITSSVPVDMLFR